MDLLLAVINPLKILTLQNYWIPRETANHLAFSRYVFIYFQR